MARIDDGDGEAGAGQRGHEGDFVTAGGLTHHERRREVLKPSQQAREARVIVGDAKRFRRRTHVDVELVFGDIDPDEERFHDPSL